jgi:hypothetical protein
MPFVTTLFEAVAAAAGSSIDNQPVREVLFFEDGQLALDLGHRQVDLADQPITLDDAGAAVVHGTGADRHFMRFFVVAPLTAEALRNSAGLPAGSYLIEGILH